MDEGGRPGYLAEVVDRLPSSLLAELLVPREAKWGRFNTGLLASMSERTFRRTVADTLDPVYFHGRRGAVSWEWLEIVAALQDLDRMASLLQSAESQGLAGFEPILRRLVAAVAMSSETLDMDRTALRRFRRLHFSGGEMLAGPRLRVEAEIRAHLKRHVPDSHRFLLREVEEIIAGLGAASGDEERFAAAVRGGLTPESKLAAQSALADIAAADDAA